MGEGVRSKPLGPGDDRGLDPRLLRPGHRLERREAGQIEPARDPWRVKHGPAGKGDRVQAQGRCCGKQLGMLQRRRVQKREMAQHPGRHDLEMRAMRLGRGVLMRVEDHAQFGVGAVRQEEQPQGNAELRHELETVWEGLLSGKLTGSARIDLSSVPQQVWLQCHPERLNQILLNLLTNALGASDRQGVIRVEAKFDDGFWEIAIADSGTGFAADTLKRAFDPFYTTSATGTGLGLPLCRTIVEGYGGSIALGNRQPTGAVVTLRVPAHKE